MISDDDKLNFIAVDVETANADMASICQIGIVGYSDGVLTREWATLVDPEDYFDGVNVSIHGISEEDVAGSPTFPELFEEISGLLDGNICVSHTHFDRVSLQRALTKYELRNIDPVWLDSSRVARRAWKQFARKGYGLANVCETLGYRFEHHNALEDAKAAGRVMLAAIEETGIGLEDWLPRVRGPIDPARSGSAAHIVREGNSEGELFGETVVFTGSLEITRREAADMAADIGCSVGQGVTKKTTLLVVGDQDVSKLSGHKKSAKHRKAEQLIAKGQAIRIIRESDFKGLIEHARSLDGTGYADQPYVQGNRKKVKQRPSVRRDRSDLVVTIDLSSDSVFMDEIRGKLREFNEALGDLPECERRAVPADMEAEETFAESIEDMSDEELSSIDRSTLTEEMIELLDEEIEFRGE